MTGKIIKAIAGFYYIHTASGKLYQTRARGVLRRDGQKPLVGDNVEFDVISEEKSEGNLIRVIDRRNVLIRPAVANIDQALIVFAVREPDPNLNLLDRFLIYMGMQNIPVIIYFNKSDLNKDGLLEKYKNNYEKAGYQIISGSTFDEETAAEIKKILMHKTTVLAGPSGVGKSSLTNLIHQNANMEIGELSEKIKRGKQTTRHTELFCIDEDSYLLDTPGFTSLTIPELDSDDVKLYFDEFNDASEKCKFAGCRHVNEAEKICGVKQAVASGLISRERYENYLQIYNEIKESERK
ncbi:MAG: ribosome small subunit-dependent GTPase A [Eubacteriales bacterium]|nr:ribosome small subunit-dependent GTPase A [Eubacteriales bacterium]